jgi:hypothetical protein
MTSLGRYARSFVNVLQKWVFVWTGFQSSSKTNKISHLRAIHFRNHRQFPSSNPMILQGVPN